MTHFIRSSRQSELAGARARAMARGANSIPPRKPRLVQACRSAVRTPPPELHRPPPVLFRTHHRTFLSLPRLIRPVEKCGSVGSQLHLDWKPAALGLEPSCTPTRTLLCKPY
jgi:hypothetical protein